MQEKETKCIDIGKEVGKKSFLKNKTLGPMEG